MSEPEKTELTNGQKLVGLKFNPAKSDDVTKIKQAAADLIDAMQALDLSQEHPQMHFLQRAVDDTISAQMFAVKAATWKKDE